MPPKVKVSKESIIKTAVDMVRESGAESLNARAVASALCCSTQPIFSNFKSMEELYFETVAAAYGIYSEFLKREVESGRYPAYKALGMAYVRFAVEEKELFKLLFMRDRSGEDTAPGEDFNSAAAMISETLGVSMEKAKLMHLEIWACVHGIAVMLATSFLTLEWELISSMLTDVYQGIRQRFSEDEK